jgi:hypothetical protein
VLGPGATRGGEGSRRWRRGGAGAAVSGADGRRQREEEVDVTFVLQLIYIKGLVLS